MAVPSPSSDATPAEGPRPVRTTRRRWWALATVVAVIVGFLGVTAVTGLSGPGPLRRHPVATLGDLVDAIHAEAGPLRTPDDCWRTTFRAQRDDAPPGPDRPVAAVDHLRSRVVVRVYADQIGRVDWYTAEAVQRRVAAVVRTDDRFEPDMVITEASPDGWSPLMSCELVTRGWG